MVQDFNPDTLSEILVLRFGIQIQNHPTLLTRNSAANKGSDHRVVADLSPGSKTPDVRQNRRPRRGRRVVTEAHDRMVCPAFTRATFVDIITGVQTAMTKSMNK